MPVWLVSYCDFGSGGLWQGDAGNRLVSGFATFRYLNNLYGKLGVHAHELALIENIR